MFSKIERLLIALMFALVFAGVTLVIAQAKAQPAPVMQATPDNCGACHSDFMHSWQDGPHGEAFSDPVFQQGWADQGKPGACLVCHTTGYDPATGTWSQDGVACISCHNPVPANHPKDPMPVDKSTDLCGTCHSDTRFDWQDWKISAHYQRNMTCVVCHDAHSAGLKKVDTQNSANSSTTDDVSALCITCHQEYAMNFSYSSHHQQGLSCVDCHLLHIEKTTDGSTAHQIPDHSFTASLTTCNTCHENQMHGPTQPSVDTSAAETTTPALSQSNPSMQFSSVTPEPQPVSPLGFAGLAGLLGLAFGMVLSPWLERAYHIVIKKDKDKEEDEHE